MIGSAVLAVVIVALLAAPPAQAASWQTRASSGPVRQEVSYVNSGGKLYLAGGSTAHEVYNPVTNSWSNLAPLPANIDHIQGVDLNGLVYYIGGLAGWPGPHVSTVYIYNPATNTFIQGAPMPRGRGAGGVAVFNGKIYYAGGLNNGLAVPWFDVYDPVANSWAQLPDMPRLRDHFHAAVVNGEFYAIGGRNKDINATTTANDVYDFATGSWSTGLAPLPTARGGFAAAPVGNEILIVGGEGGGLTFNTVEAYNTITNSWRTLAPIPTARHGIQAAVCDDGIYIAAGGTIQGGGGATDVHQAFVLNSPSTCASPYPHPQSASPISVSLVPAFRQCGVQARPANGQHAPPLATPSCQAPSPTSPNAAVGSGYAGLASIEAVLDDPFTPPDEANLRYTQNQTDVRGGTPSGPDYASDMTAMFRFRITDTQNCTPSPCTAPYDKPGTPTEVEFSMPVDCVSTGGPEGSTCSANTSANAVQPGAVRGGKRTVLQIFRVRVNDAGTNSIPGDADDTLFAQQGVYIP